MTTAREDTTRLAELLRLEHHAMADFLIALSTFDRERRWSELGYPSLFSFLTRELRLSAGAAQYRKTAAELIQRFPDVEAALRRGDLCLSSVVEVSKVLTPENAAEVLPRFFGKSSRDAAFVAASIRPVADPPRRDFIVAPLRAAPVPGPVAADTMGVFRAPETTSIAAPPSRTSAACRPSRTEERPKVRPLDAERARMNITVPRRLLDKLAAARDALSHSHPGASEDAILEVGLDLIIERHRKRRGIGAKPRKTTRAPQAPASAACEPAPVAAAVLSAASPAGAAASPDARRLYGDDLMDRYTRAKGPRCSEPAATWRGAPAPYSEIRYCCSFA